MESACALENQKELRKSQIKTRDLEASRSQWKERAACDNGFKVGYFG